MQSAVIPEPLAEIPPPIDSFDINEAPTDKRIDPNDPKKFPNAHWKIAPLNFNDSIRTGKVSCKASIPVLRGTFLPMVRSKINKELGLAVGIDSIMKFVQYAKSFQSDSDLMQQLDNIGYEIKANNQEFVSVMLADDNYSGGIHPNTFYTSESFYTETGELLTLDSIINVDRKSEFMDSIISVLKKYSYLKDGWEDHAREELNSFYLTDSAIIPYYEPYILVNSTDGKIECSLSFKKIKNLIAPRFAAKLGKIKRQKFE
jgi:hypothetical protein